MKKVFSILFASIIFLSGMNLTFVTHLCGGEVSTVKLSFVHENASCGMCGEKQTTSNYKTINTKGCCKDEITFCIFENNYSPSTFQITEPTDQSFQIFCISETIGDHFFNATSYVNTYIQSPGNYISRAVSLSDICVFLI